MEPGCLNCGQPYAGYHYNLDLPDPTETAPIGGPTIRSFPICIDGLAPIVADLPQFEPADGQQPYTITHAEYIITQTLST